MRIRAAFGTSAVIEWGLKELLPLILLVLGIGIIARARTGRLSDNAGTLANVLMGVCVIVSAGAIMAFATQMGDLLQRGG